MWKKETIKHPRRLREIVRISARECLCEGRKCIDFSSNNYLALANDPRLIEESIEWTRRLGAGNCASRLITGSLKEYLELEERIAEWKGTESALLFGSGYLANLGVISAISGKETIIFADKLNHNSLVNACLLTKSEFVRYKHLDIESVSEKIYSHKQNSVIVSDTVFSMDGDIADTAKIAKFADSGSAIVYLDEAHASGIFGERGSGLAEALQPKENLICMGTFSKAMGSYGACVACSKSVREFLINKCPTFIYSTALPPSVCGAISAAVRLVQTAEFCEIRKKLLENSAKLAKEIRRLGFDTGNTSTPIIPIIIGDSELALRISQFLFENGIFALAIRPPTVPEGSSRIRISINAAHKEEDFEKLLVLLQNIKKNIVGNSSEIIPSAVNISRPTGATPVGR